MKELLVTLLDGVSSSLNEPVCRTLTSFDCRTQVVRLEENAVGNWFADVVRHAYDDTLSMKGIGGADGVLLCGGAIRGDAVYGPGLLRLGDIMEMLPFEDTMVAIGIDGPTLWAALESAVGMWPAQEGRFPILSGFRAEWDSRKPPGQRVQGLWVERVEESYDDDDDYGFGPLSPGATPSTRLDGEPVSRKPGGKTYVLITPEYIAHGHDGYGVLKDCKVVAGVDDEHGLLMSTIVRKFLLGSRYITHMKKLQSRSISGPSPPTSPESAKARARWLDAGRKIIAQVSARHNSRDINHALRASMTENMAEVDCYDGELGRAGGHTHMRHQKKLSVSVDLPEVAPVVDGRLRNVATVKLGTVL